jgi:hypothetical protein
MQAEYASYAPDARAILSAFTDGINAHIAALAQPGGAGIPAGFLQDSRDPWHPEIA